MGFRKRKNQDWFDENDVTIQSLLESKSKAYNALSKCVTGFHELLSLKSRFNSIKTEIQGELRKMQNTWWSKKADEIQLAADTKNTRVFYSLLREVYGPSSFSITPLKSKDNKHLIRDPLGILNRWKEHFDDLLNKPSEFNSELVESIPTKPVEDALGDEIAAQEVEEAVQKLNSGKSPDMNGLLAEFFHCVGPVFMGRLTTLLQTAWRTETIFEDWRNSLLVVLYKGKGPKNDCSNYRGISLLSVVGKILGRIIFKRINLHIADNIARIPVWV